MDIDDSTPAGPPAVHREKTAPFLIRTFVRIGGFHRLTLFEDGTFPTTDEQQIFTWKDATLREILTTLRNTAPHVAEYRHPLARYLFKTVYADPSNKGRYSQKDIGTVYSRDILGEPGTLSSTAPRLLQDTESSTRDGGGGEREREERTLDELRFLPGDFLIVSVVLPKNITLPSEISIKGSGAAAATTSSGPSNGWRGGAGGPAPGKSDGGWARGAAPPQGRGGGHWRGDSNAPSGTRGRGGGRGGGGGDSGRDSYRDLDRPDSRIPPPRRNDSPPPRGGWGNRNRGGRGGRSRSRSRSPPRRRNRND